MHCSALRACCCPYVFRDGVEVVLLLAGEDDVAVVAARRAALARTAGGDGVLAARHARDGQQGQQRQQRNPGRAPHLAATAMRWGEAGVRGALRVEVLAQVVLVVVLLRASPSRD